MNKLLYDNYNAIVNRGFISNTTFDKDFYSKLLEELKELFEELGTYKDQESVNQEITDVINVCNNWLIHNGFDPEIELKKCLEKQLKRLMK